jgi:IS5 family transposase
MRWTKKNNTNFFGYKNHVKEDAQSKLITKYMVTAANTHDANATSPLLDEKGKGEAFYADSAYSGEPQEMYIQSIGIKRATATIGLMNLTYNMYRSLVLTAQVVG